MKAPLAIVTGANSGIGYATCKGIAEAGFEVHMACRTKENAKASAKRLQEEVPEATITGAVVDLADPASIEALAKHYDANRGVDVLVNNAGILVTGQETVGGIEKTFRVNHVGTYELTLRMLPSITRRQGRIVTVASAAHRYAKLDVDTVHDAAVSYGERAYARSKLCNILFTRSLAERVRDTGVTANCLHPGTGATQLWRRYPAAIQRGFEWFTKSPATLAKTSIYLATSSDVMEQSGLYFSRSEPATPSRQARDPALAEALWHKSVDLTGLDVTP